jgi:hypothetical protein
VEHLPDIDEEDIESLDLRKHDKKRLLRGLETLKVDGKHAEQDKDKQKETTLKQEVVSERKPSPPLPQPGGDGGGGGAATVVGGVGSASASLPVPSSAQRNTSLPSPSTRRRPPATAGMTNSLEPAPIPPLPLQAPTDGVSLGGSLMEAPRSGSLCPPLPPTFAAGSGLNSSSDVEGADATSLSPFFSDPMDDGLAFRDGENRGCDVVMWS